MRGEGAALFISSVATARDGSDGRREHEQRRAVFSHLMPYLGHVTT